MKAKNNIEVNTYCMNCQMPTNTDKTEEGNYVCSYCGDPKRINQHKSVYPTLKQFAIFLLVGTLAIIGVISIIIWGFHKIFG